MSAEQVEQALRGLGNAEKAVHLARFFKTGPGEYGAGDRFLGVRVPEQRAVALRFRQLDPSALQSLLQSPWHECRLTGLLILVAQYEAGDAAIRHRVYRFYCDHLAGVNNWDLVDLSTPKIMGRQMLDQVEERRLLERLVVSTNLWERRMAILATFPFIKARRFDETLAMATRLLGDKQDLIHKAVGWMLRELGKVDQATEERFLAIHCRAMPRTMLRYAIERFTPERRALYM